MSKAVCSRSEHDAMKRDHSVWSKLEQIGWQKTEDDDGNVMWLDCRNCGCGSTLSVIVLMRDAQTEAA